MDNGLQDSSPSAKWPALVYVLLLAIGIPWYWPADDHRIVLGMPGWVIIAIAASACASIFTAWLLAKPWPDESKPEND
ncbi:MAG: hypothetical protein ACU85U_12725 [Gammaproteobacteria bacterium]|jgi:hypothetical protein